MSGTNSSDLCDTMALLEHVCVQDGKDRHCQVWYFTGPISVCRFRQLLFFAVIFKWPQNKDVWILPNALVTCIFWQQTKPVWDLDSFFFLLWYLNGHKIKTCKFCLKPLWRVYFDNKQTRCGIWTAIFFGVGFNWPQVKNVHILPTFPFF